MVSSFLHAIRGVFSLSIYTLNTLIVCAPIFSLAIIKAILPIRPVQTLCRRLITACATGWIGVNNLNQRLLNGIHWEVKGIDNLDPKGWYMVVANHQSWVDILVLQNVFHRKIPFLKFFLKRELFWFPVMGQAWWALDFPFMKRYSRGFLKKNPHLIGKDLEITKKACEKFRAIPVSVMNFVEGTRFTAEKHSRQCSPYNHLLRTKAGGLAFALAAMGDKIQQIVDVTIVYPDGVGSFWDFLCGRVKKIKVHVKTRSIDHEMMGDYLQDAHFKRNFQQWLNGMWHEKDAEMGRMLAG